MFENQVESAPLRFIQTVDDFAVELTRAFNSDPIVIFPIVNLIPVDDIECNDCTAWGTKLNDRES